jgi:hypothetical protein
VRSIEQFGFQPDLAGASRRAGEGSITAPSPLRRALTSTWNMAWPTWVQAVPSICIAPAPSAAISSGNSASAAARSQRGGRVIVGIASVSLDNARTSSSAAAWGDRAWAKGLARAVATRWRAFDKGLARMGKGALSADLG